MLLLLLLPRSEELIEQGAKWLVDGGSLDFTGAKPHSRSAATGQWQPMEPSSCSLHDAGKECCVYQQLRGLQC